MALDTLFSHKPGNKASTKPLMIHLERDIVRKYARLGHTRTRAINRISSAKACPIGDSFVSSMWSLRLAS